MPATLRRGGGALVFTGSFVGNSVGLPGMGPYAAAKAGILALVRGITADYASSDIRANALLPGGTDTDTAGDDVQREWAAGLHAMKRIAQPQEIAQSALFLASDMSSFVTGSVLWADGGNAPGEIASRRILRDIPTSRETTMSVSELIAVCGRLDHHHYCAKPAVSFMCAIR